MSYASPFPILRDSSHAFRPPKRVSVSQGAADILRISHAGGYSGPWSAEEAPYMVEPMDMLASRKHEVVCFVGPARTGKTMGLIDGWMSHNVANDPGAMLVVQMTQTKAREYSKTRVDQAIKNSPALNELLSIRGHDDNTHDKLFKNGMWLKIGWPSESQLSSSDYRYVAWTDYDRAPDDIDGGGSGYLLLLKRIQTYLSRGMAMFESSPGRDYDDAYWEPSSPHEFPPVSGVGGIYNNSDRRRWYWQCFDCSEYFEAKPGLELFATLPKENELLDMVRTADLSEMSKKHSLVCCPNCGSQIAQSHKPELNSIKTARWLGEGQTITRDREITGDYIQSNIAGYCLGGVAAAYQKWDNLILRELQGLREYVVSGSDQTLKTTRNTDQGLAYLPIYLKEDKTQNAEDRIDHKLDRYHVPDWARVLIATVDVQGGVESNFVCEVRAFGVSRESCLVDRFSLRNTERGGKTVRVDPAAYIEDWDLLTDRLVNATYKTSTDKELRVYRTGVDTGGEKGVTPNAYAWFKKLRAAGLSDRVYLVKGGNHKQEKPVVKSYARDSRGRRMREVPIYLIATNYFKDIVANSMRRDVPGPGYFHPSAWLPAGYFKELRAETRGVDGKWKNLKRAANEAFDCWCYAEAIMDDLGFGANGRESWEKPPMWALPMLDGNTQMVDKEERIIRKAVTKKRTRGRSSLASGNWGRRL
jgi:phage terminase large subunit GpA-like protein